MSLTTQIPNPFKPTEEFPRLSIDHPGVVELAKIRSIETADDARIHTQLWNSLNRFDDTGEVVGVTVDAISYLGTFVSERATMLSTGSTRPESAGLAAQLRMAKWLGRSALTHEDPATYKNALEYLKNRNITLTSPSKAFFARLALRASSLHETYTIFDH